MAGAIASGKRLKDRYRLERTLGRGGMAAVWLGHDERLDRPVAVKVLSDTIASDPAFLARFRREAKTAAALSHPNLVRVYDFSDRGERPYLVMELVPGEDLAARLGRGERVDCERLAQELLEALAHIHAAGILHRDVKPGNVIVEPDGTAKLIDFGIALPRDATALTSTGLVLATERYAAPEVMEGSPATERSDLYSCGVVLRSCAGPRPPALEALIGAMTERDPHRRPRSAAAALQRLQRPRPRRRPAPAEPPTEVLRVPPTDPRPADPRSTDRRHIDHRQAGRRPGGRRRVVAAALGLLAALAVVAVVAVAALSGSDDPDGGGQAAKSGQGGERAAPAAQREADPAAQAEPDPATSAPTPEDAAAEPPQAAEAAPEAGAGAALNEEGFSLIQAAEYEAAVPVLEQAVGSFPAGSEDLAYAYALFNLGNALRLSGRPEEAIPILERRLEIPNQEATVREELEAAYAEADAAPPSTGDD